MSTSATMPNVAGHTVAVASLAGTIANVLPPVLAALGSFLAVVWYAVQIYESRSFQRWLARHKRH